MRLDRRRMEERVRALAAEFGLSQEDLKLPVGEFGALKKRVVEIVKALAFDTRLLILDEPTSGLEERSGSASSSICGACGKKEYPSSG
jgi:ABC-type sugar transport system ATPase subunit